MKQSGRQGRRCSSQASRQDRRADTKNTRTPNSNANGNSRLAIVSFQLHIFSLDQPSSHWLLLLLNNPFVILLPLRFNYLTRNSVKKASNSAIKSIFFGRKFARVSQEVNTKRLTVPPAPPCACDRELGFAGREIECVRKWRFSGEAKLSSPGPLGNLVCHFRKNDRHNA